MANKDGGKNVNEDIIFLESNIPKDFVELDESFRCQICASLFDKAVAIKECGHTFCSVCIRNYWVAVRSGIHRQKKSCPICRMTINTMDVEKALVMNRSIQEGVKAFKKMLLNHHISSSGQVPMEALPSNRLRRTCRNKKRKSPTTNVDDSFADIGDAYVSANGESSGDEESPIRKKMESRNYGRMKKRDLQKLCRERKISTSGNEQELIDRLRNYQNMWNAEVLHSINPKRPSDIAAQLTQEEEAQRKEKKRAQTTGASKSEECMKKLNASRSRGNNKITSGDATFDRDLKANFEAMTVELQARMKKRVRSYTKNNLKSGGSPEIVNHNMEKHLPCEIGEGTQPISTSIEIIDVDSCSHIPNQRILRSRTDKGERTASLRPSTSRPNTSPGMGFSSPTCDGPSTYNSSAKENTTIPMDQMPSLDKRSGFKNRRRSATPTWACRRCTFENKGIDYLCQICGHRKNDL